MEKYYEQSKNVNLCAARAYYVPFEKGQAVSYDRADSARFVDLNGIWKIKAYETVLDAENFLMEECEKEIPVPSCVQYHGLDWFQYTNCYYPYPFAGTVVPNRNPAYHYTRTFTLPNAADEKIYFITEEVVGEIDYGEGMKNIYAYNGADVLDIEISPRFVRNVNVGEVKLAANTYGKGRSVYIAGLPYSPQNSRLLLRAMFWSASKEEEMKKAYSSNPVTDCTYYPETKKYAVINNTNEQQATTFYDVNGKATEMTLAPNSVAWVEA